MRRLLLYIGAALLIGTGPLSVGTLQAQDDVYPAAPQKGKFFIVGGTIHIGNGQVMENGTIAVDNGKIVQVGQQITIPQDSRVIDAHGRQVYPGLILPVTDLGLKEIAGSVR